MAERLTDSAIAALTCPPGKKDGLFFDSTLRGFAIRVTSGGTKTFLVQYKTAGRTKRVVLGSWGTELTCAQGRRKAEQVRGQVREGRDPAEERKIADRAARSAAARDAFTVEALIDTWTELHLSGRANNYRLVTPRALKAALTGFLATPATAFAKADAIALLDGAKAARGPVAANRLRAAGRACWGWAVGRGELEVNPWATTPRPAQEQSRERVLSDLELTAVWRAAEDLADPWRAIVHLLILTGQRRGEISATQWTELDLAARTWTIGRDRTKNHQTHTVPLPILAADIFSQSPRIEGAILVFQNGQGTAPSGFGRVKRRLDKALGESVAPWTLHDLRRSCATGLQRLGVRIEVIEAILNHVSGTRGGIVGVYQRHTWHEEKRTALDAWANHVAALLKAATPVSAPPKKKVGRPVGSKHSLNVDLLGPMAAEPAKGGKALAGQRVRDGDLPAHRFLSEAKRHQRLKAELDAVGSSPAGRIVVIEQNEKARRELTEAFLSETKRLQRLKSELDAAGSSPADRIVVIQQNE